MTIDFFAPGVASTKGSARGFVVNGRAVITNDAGPKAKTWAGVISTLAMAAMRGRAPMSDAVSVALTFYMPRPKAHSTASGLRADAPTWCSKRPDVDKLARCALDALTGIVIQDDALIAQLMVTKVYANASAGCRFVVEPIAPHYARGASKKGGM